MVISPDVPIPVLVGNTIAQAYWLELSRMVSFLLACSFLPFCLRKSQYFGAYITKAMVFRRWVWWRADDLFLLGVLFCQIRTCITKGEKGYVDLLMVMQGKVKQNGKDRGEFSGLLAQFGIAEGILI